MASNNEPWKECSEWLIRCEVLRQDHKANWPDAAVSDLAYTLRDGVLICSLLNTLDPGCIDMKDVNQKPQMARFLCLRNIKTFLQACLHIFGLKESDLFEPSMLFDLSDFFRVLNTLSKLSNCPKAQRKCIMGFSVHKNRNGSQEEIYKKLNSNESDEPSRQLSDDVEYGSYYSRIRNEEIYQDLCSIGRRSPQQIPCTVSQSLDKRDYVISELVETEKNYVEVLLTVQKHFMRPLSTALREEDMLSVFGGMKELADIHQGFLSQLRKAVKPGGTVRLSEVFLNWREKFLVYGEYCANLTNAQAVIQDVCARSELVHQEVLKCQQEANNGKFKLRDILSVPMQRILKYHLLLDKLISDTLPSHDDFRGLERAKEAMVDVAQYINEVKRDSDLLQVMQAIQTSISDWNMPENTELKDYGRLLKDDELRIKAHDDQKIKVRYVFIFDQVMLMCKSAKGDTYSYRESLNLSEYKVEDPISRPILRRDSRWSYQWYLIRKTERTAYTMYARTDDLKRKWIKAIQDALDNIEPLGSRNTDHKFVMHTFNKPTTCNHCSKFLKGLIFQGYQCECCQIPIHKACIPYSGRCGIKQAPEPPPRPPIPRQTPPVQNGLLGEYLWFVGEMRREQATNLLEQQVDGTFLLRIRPQGRSHPNETIYALSLKTDDKVKHMKVYEKLMDGTPQYYLSESHFFKSIVELIDCYEHSSLGENFVGLDVMLKLPFRKMVAVAEFDYNPAEANQLALRKGCQVEVLSKEGDPKGWWKGKIHDKIEEEDDDYDYLDDDLLTKPKTPQSSEYLDLQEWSNEDDQPNVAPAEEASDDRQRIFNMEDSDGSEECIGRTGSSGDITENDATDGGNDQYVLMAANDRSTFVGDRQYVNMTVDGGSSKFVGDDYYIDMTGGESKRLFGTSPNTGGSAGTPPRNVGAHLGSADSLLRVAVSGDGRKTSTLELQSDHRGPPRTADASTQAPADNNMEVFMRFVESEMQHVRDRVILHRLKQTILSAILEAVELSDKVRALHHSPS